MLKLIHKKLQSKKGFTLAELLVVIAILAIIIAIAIPVFTNMVADAQLRVNQANVRSVRSAAVAEILTNMAGKDSNTPAIDMNEGTGKNHGWIVIAEVNNNGDMSKLKIFALTSETDCSSGRNDAICLGKVTNFLDSNFVQMGDNPQSTGDFAALKPSNAPDGSGVYTVRVYISDSDYVKGT